MKRHLPRVRSTTILAVHSDGQVALGGDGQVTVGQTVMKSNAQKVRTLPADAAVVLGCVTAVFAALTTMPVTWGAVLALGTAAGVVVLAVAGRSLPLLAVGAVGLFSTVPRAMMRLVPGSTGAALGLLVAGCVLVAGAVLTLRRGHRV
jgi:hypothetical protein